MKKPKVYVVHRKGFDITAALAYGDPVVVFEDKVPHSFNVPLLIYTIKKILDQFTENDYLMLCGNVLPNSLALSLALERVPTVNLMLFDVKTNDYLIRTIGKYQFQPGGVHG